MNDYSASDGRQAGHTYMYPSQPKRYEAGISQPTHEVFRKIVIALNISADMLLFDKKERVPDEKKTIKELLEGMLLRHEAKKLHSLQTQSF